MGLLSHRVERSEIKPGDHIYTWRAGYTYSHHGTRVSSSASPPPTQAMQAAAGPEVRPAGRCLPLLLSFLVSVRAIRVARAEVVESQSFAADDASSIPAAIALENAAVLLNCRTLRRPLLLCSIRASSFNSHCPAPAPFTMASQFPSVRVWYYGDLRN